MTQITIVGLGLIGGSIAAALPKDKYKIIAIDTDSSVLQRAKNAAVIHEGYENVTPEALCSDIILLCVYPDDALEFVVRHHKSFKKSSILSDVVGIKTPLMQLCDSLESEFIYVGGHPMAGREVGGFANSSADLFRGASFIITPSTKALPLQIEKIEKLAKDILCERIIKTTPENHDHIIAYTSQLPHIIAAAICDNPSLGEYKGFTGGSFEDVTRVARINGDLWSQLICGNKQNILEHMGIFADTLEKIRCLIENDNVGGLQAIFDDIRAKKERF